MLQNPPPPPLRRHRFSIQRYCQWGTAAATGPGPAKRTYSEQVCCCCCRCCCCGARRQWPASVSECVAKHRARKRRKNCSALTINQKAHAKVGGKENKAQKLALPSTTNTTQQNHSDHVNAELQFEISKQHTHAHRQTPNGQTKRRLR